MSILVVVPCGKRKIWDRSPAIGPVHARDAYIGAPFKVNRKYAKRFAERWVILSAKYGFIDPDFVIPGNYNVTFKDPRTNPVSISRLVEQIREKGLYGYDKVVVLGGRDYVDVVRRAFSKFKVKVIAPTLGLPLGKAMAKVREAIENDSPFDC